jgi:tRNA(Ile)-lysidine synthase
MEKITRNLLTEWRKLNLPFANKTFVIAVSGGADSIALAYSIKELTDRKKFDNKFYIAHFNHNLRGTESIADEELVKNTAIKLNINFFSQIARKNEISVGGNIEQQARIARYNFLHQFALEKNAFAVLTGHTLNDQAETFLLNLIRGSGLKGLRAMEPVRKLNEKCDLLLVRPMLGWAKREDIEKYAQKKGIKFTSDSMNDDKNFKRVRIRKEIIPTLEKLNPNIVDTLAQSASNLSDEFNLIDELFVKNDNYQKIVNSKKLRIKTLKTLSNPLFYKIIREWLMRQRGDLRGLNYKHLEAIYKLINSRKSGKTVQLPRHQIVIKKNGKLLFQVVEVEK